MDIGKKIRILRTNSNMTQQELANKINKTPITIRKYELNQIIPPINVLEDISKVFNKPIVYFFNDYNFNNSEIADSPLSKDILSLIDNNLDNPKFDCIKDSQNGYLVNEIKSIFFKIQKLNPILKEINIKIEILNKDTSFDVKLSNSKTQNYYILTVDEFNLLYKKLIFNIKNEIKFLKYFK